MSVEVEGCCDATDDSTGLYVDFVVLLVDGFEVLVGNLVVLGVVVIDGDGCVTGRVIGRGRVFLRVVLVVGIMVVLVTRVGFVDVGCSMGVVVTLVHFVDDVGNVGLVVINENQTGNNSVTEYDNIRVALVYSRYGKKR